MAEQLAELNKTSLGYVSDIGKIEAFMRTTAPTGYLACDGTTYYIADYPLLANLFLNEFGSYSYFGGNGTTTFAVPDLRGEFLRGTGTNGHTDQGSGANVGTHQDGTAHINFYVSNTAELSYYPDKDNSPLDSSIYADAFGSYECTSSAYLKASAYARYPLQTPAKSIFRSRPTNTSVLYCIRAY